MPGPALLEDGSWACVAPLSPWTFTVMVGEDSETAVGPRGRPLLELILDAYGEEPLEPECRCVLTAPGGELSSSVASDVPPGDLGGKLAHGGCPVLPFADAAGDPAAMLDGRIMDQLVEGCDPPHDLGVRSPRLYAGVSARLSPGVRGLFFSGFTATAAAFLNACSTSAASMARFSLPADRSDFPLSLPDSPGEPSGERLVILACSPSRAAAFLALRLSPVVGGTLAAARAGPVFSVSAAAAAEPTPTRGRATPAVTPRGGPLGGRPCFVA